MRAKAAGFTLIELLVGAVIALLGSLAIMQTYLAREADRRSIGSLSDSQANAMIALFMIERDLQQAGMGLMDLRTLGCTISSTSSPMTGLPMIGAGIVTADGAVNPWNLPMGDANSDMIMVAYGTSPNTSEGRSLSRTISAGSTVLAAAGVGGFQVNDSVLVAEDGKDCTYAKIVAADPATLSITLDGPTGATYSSSARIFNLGAQPRMLAYAIRNGSLTVCDFAKSNCTEGADDSSVWVPVANDIVALHAQYGMDTSVPTDGMVDAYCQAASNKSCAAGSTPAPANSCDYARIGSMLVGVIARSPQADREQVSSATIQVWKDAVGSPTTTGPTWPVPDRYYRYRVVSSSVALRNIQFMGAQSGC